MCWGGGTARQSGRTGDRLSPNIRYYVGTFNPGNTHPQIVGAGLLQKEERGDTNNEKLVDCVSEVNRAIFAQVIKNHHTNTDSH